MLGASLAANKAKIICQQCLAPGHWTYECKNGSTYQVRASASRQLKQKRFKQAFLEEEAPEVPFNAFLGLALGAFFLKEGFGVEMVASEHCSILKL
ncbi:Zcchc10 [Symbiodinium necroappetens]|uniref:Zcchc10 protein n=1 Tax=Symbiodinium necroappetens TaxID=1628268 RepID=A0A812WVP4_9DINO|nr:Zcchc10 [Symbiodinium necroappetens]